MKTDANTREIYVGIYEIVKKIPSGFVSTYGEVAKRAGNAAMARVVGRALHNNPDPKRIPCHRVVNAKGQVAEAFAFGGAQGQTDRLRAEGVMVENGRVDLRKYNYCFDGARRAVCDERKREG